MGRVGGRGQFGPKDLFPRGMNSKVYLFLSDQLNDKFPSRVPGTFLLDYRRDKIISCNRIMESHSAYTSCLIHISTCQHICPSTYIYLYLACLSVLSKCLVNIIIVLDSILFSGNAFQILITLCVNKNRLPFRSLPILCNLKTHIRITYLPVYWPRRNWTSGLNFVIWIIDVACYFTMWVIWYIVIKSIWSCLWKIFDLSSHVFEGCSVNYSAIEHIWNPEDMHSI